jgi:hypothetical protein
MADAQQPHKDKNPPSDPLRSERHAALEVSQTPSNEALTALMAAALERVTPPAAPAPQPRRDRMSADVDSGSGSDGGSDSDGLVRDELAHLHGPGVARRRAARALRLAERRSATLSSENDALRVQLTMLRERETAAVLAAATARGQADAAATSEAQMRALLHQSLSEGREMEAEAAAAGEYHQQLLDVEADAKRAALLADAEIVRFVLFSCCSFVVG